MGDMDKDEELSSHESLFHDKDDDGDSTEEGYSGPITRSSVKGPRASSNLIVSEPGSKKLALQTDEKQRHSEDLLKIQEYSRVMMERYITLQQSERESVEARTLLEAAVEKARELAKEESTRHLKEMESISQQKERLKTLLDEERAKNRSLFHSNIRRRRQTSGSSEESRAPRESKKKIRIIESSVERTRLWPEILREKDLVIEDIERQEKRLAQTKSKRGALEAEYKKAREDHQMQNRRRENNPIEDERRSVISISSDSDASTSSPPPTSSNRLSDDKGEEEVKCLAQ
jgi:hypothetical protein